MLDEVCRDLRVEWPGGNRDRRGRSRYGLGEEEIPEPRFRFEESKPRDETAHRDERTRSSEFADDVGVITINNPPVNALSSRVAERLASAVRRAYTSDSVRSIVVIGSGTRLSRGQIFANWPRSLAELHRWTCSPLCRQSKISKPVVMAIHGAAFGGGLETAMCGHYRLAVLRRNWDAGSKIGTLSQERRNAAAAAT